MKIGIDCRMFGPKHTGIGRYVQNLVKNLLEANAGNEFVLFVRNTEEKEIENLKIKYSFQIKNFKLKIVSANINHYSLKEQLILPKIISDQKLDLMHFPHFNVPVFYSGKYVVTIHDLIKHSSRGRETTTKSSGLYWLKYLGYKFVFRQAVKRASKIIVPSNFVKSEVVKEYGVDPNKIAVTYEGVDEKLQIAKSVLSLSKDCKFQTNTKYKILNTKYRIHKPYVLYVGSVYPHKNIERLIEAVRLINKSITYHLSPITLVIVCARNVFSERLNNKIVQMKAEGCVKMVGYVPDEELTVLYQEAEAFVFPTLSEGFGLPGLEAMSVGCPVVCSDIPVLREIYKDSAIYFDPRSVGDIVEKINGLLLDKKLQEKLSKSGFELVKIYSWKKTAKETLDVYQTV